MLILNIHGFLGEADNKNYKALCKMMPAKNIISPQLDYMGTSPEKILEKLSSMVSSQDFIFVGQSLGGWFADNLSRKFKRPCILTNPCYFPHHLKLIKESGISFSFLDEYEKLTPSSKNQLAYTLCSESDELLAGNYDNCSKLSGLTVKVQGSHSTIENIGQHLADALEKINENPSR